MRNVILLGLAAIVLVGCGGNSPTAISPVAVDVATPAPLANGEYSYGFDAAQKLDAYIPAAGSAAPLVIVVHGGGWLGGDKGGMPASYMRDLTTAGYVVLNVNYRLTRYPDPLEDLDAVVAWARSNGLRGTYAVIGASAGAHIAALHCATATACRGFVGIGGIYDVTRPDVSPINQAGLERAMTDWLGCSLSECPGRWAGVSPALIAARPVRSLLIHGAADATIRPAQSEAMAAHVRGDLVRAAGLPHWSDAYVTGALLQRQLDFLAAAL